MSKTDSKRANERNSESFPLWWSTITNKMQGSGPALAVLLIADEQSKSTVPGLHIAGKPNVTLLLKNEKLNTGTSPGSVFPCGRVVPYCVSFFLSRKDIILLMKSKVSVLLWNTFVS